MTKQPVLTAEQTPNCPPHHWKIGSDNIGRCLKCPAVRDFGRLLRRYRDFGYSREKARLGGKRRQERAG